jgi:hypothetical protein
MAGRAHRRCLSRKRARVADIDGLVTAGPGPVRFATSISLQIPQIRRGDRICAPYGRNTAFSTSSAATDEPPPDTRTSLRTTTYVRK